VRTGDRKLAQLDQRIAIFAGRQCVEALDRTGHVITGQLRGVFQRTGCFHGNADAFQVFDPAFLDRLTHQCSLFRRAFAHGVDQRQGRLAFGQIVTDVLAQGFRVALVVQQVVDQLERHAR
jgi:hypothetical protein